MTDFVEPMKATLTDDRFDDRDWIFEHKLDGVRVIAVRRGSEVCLWSRNRNRMDRSYPEIVEALEGAGPSSYVIDGEIVAFDGQRTSFERLQRRMHVEDPEKARRTGVAVYLYLFDAIELDGEDLTDLPLLERKERLEEAFVWRDPLRFTTHRRGNGIELYEAACTQGWEGLIAKHVDSRYRPGKRSPDWLKWKCVARQEFVIGGFTEPRGSRTGFGALLVGYHEDDRFRYAGKVGTGFDEELLSSLHSRLLELETEDPPFDERVRERTAHWVEPQLVCEVGFGEWTQDGKLRHPRFLGLRDDKDPRRIVREQPV